MVLTRRVAAAQATINAFLDKTFSWGEYDCARLAGYALKELGRDDPLIPFGSYSTELGAVRALKKQGRANLIEAIEALGLERIAPARALPADIVAMPADDDRWVALGVAIGDGRVLAFSPEGQCTWGSLKAATAAWRAI
ncbi:hypothetical protein Q0812_10375 [Brevundimonas sp. 2R-24]|uniref:DUF6950 domain-containing protein n=1 Tax=Peiella sedimenti TaxID=3061083 RepID=A0ABT8SN91_9CAUL|nr:hypothetical protein [Caulobacteraceae bacterium XZ-24]